MISFDDALNSLTEAFLKIGQAFVDDRIAPSPGGPRYSTLYLDGDTGLFDVWRGEGGLDNDPLAADIHDICTNNVEEIEDHASRDTAHQTAQVFIDDWIELHNSHPGTPDELQIESRPRS